MVITIIQRKKDISAITFFGMIILLLEILSVGSIFPLVYSINEDDFYEKLKFLEFFQEFFFQVKNTIFQYSF